MKNLKDEVQWTEGTCVIPEQYTPLPDIIFEWAQILNDVYDRFWVERDGNHNGEAIKGIHEKVRRTLEEYDQAQGVSGIGNFKSFWNEKY